MVNHLLPVTFGEKNGSRRGGAEAVLNLKPNSSISIAYHTLFGPHDDLILLELDEKLLPDILHNRTLIGPRRRRKILFRWDDLVKRVEELMTGLRALSALEIDGYWRILDEKYMDIVICPYSQSRDCQRI
ncbi:hypothetical protein HHK36_033096 [Tetracentron sinense]|uniref:Uncharacterized protein n=1 Tax=Tetracentron sinense TaxID=13715 RepID=A0A835CZ02_TETSI|nr:hypothetical protein HHK36_033096 [Tetracentron sinense]